MLRRLYRLAVTGLLLSVLFSQHSYIDSTRIRDPKLAWKLSLIPGLGQIYNGKWVKALAIIGAEYLAATRFKTYQQQNKIAHRNTYAWWMTGIYVYGMLDAYVDAQLSTFPVIVDSLEISTVPKDTTTVQTHDP